jgi:hypothetical protein
MLTLLVFTPALVALILLCFWPVAQVAYAVYLPCLMLVPLYMAAAVGPLWIDCSTLLVIILFLASMFRWHRSIRFTVLDFIVLLDLFSAFYADAHYRPFKLGFYAASYSSVSRFMPYWIGRLLIEQTGMRRRWVKTMVILLACVAVVSVWEFRMELNPFLHAVMFLSRDHVVWQDQRLQMRWGFARVAGPYAYAISAGMVFSTGLMFQIWLAASDRWKVRAQPVLGRAKRLNGGQSARRAVLHQWPIFAAIMLGLFMTQSRGPWIGCALGLPIAAIGLAANRKRATFLAIGFVLTGLSISSVTINKYTDTAGETSVDQQTNEDQRNAVYRRELWSTYQPLVEQGGFWGSGSPVRLPDGGYGYLASQRSIDNEYLRLAVAQGYFGVTLFGMMIFLSVSRLVWLIRRMKAREEILFAYCMLGMIIAVSLTLTTVFLGEPMLQVLFISLGWIQSIRVTQSKTSLSATSATANAPYVFERVFV